MDKPYETISKPRSIACLQGNRIAVIGKKCCIIFDQKTGKQIKSISTEKAISDIATNKDKTLLALSRNLNPPLIYDIKSDMENSPKKHLNAFYAHTTFSSIHNTLFCRSEYKLLSYNVTNPLSDEIIKIPSNLCASQSISCHPTKNELLYGSCREQLAIVQPGCTPLIKTYLSINFICKSGNYAPDGSTIALHNKEYGQSNYFICDLNSQKAPLPAHQLIADNKNYAASKFHPHDSIIALLSTDNHVHLFDYKTFIFIVKTKELTVSKYIDDTVERKRLDFDKDGNLAVALSDTWKVIEVPRNNFYDIWKALCNNQSLSKNNKILPKELIQIIFSTIIDYYNQTYESFDLSAFLHTMPIQKAVPEKQNDNEPMEVETQTKQIKAVYKRELASPPPLYHGYGLLHWTDW